MSVTHTFVNPLADQVGFAGTKPSDWNAQHTVAILNADVDPAAAIDESKLNLNFPTHAAVTIGAPANGLSIAGQVLSLGLASALTTGALSSADWSTFNGKQNALAFPLTPDLGGTGIANAAGSTLTLGAATSITGGGTIALGGFTLTVPATGTAALLAVANVFTATQAIQGAIPALQFLDTTPAALNSGMYTDGNIMYITTGTATNGTGVIVSFNLSTRKTEYLGDFSVFDPIGGNRLLVTIGAGSGATMNLYNSVAAITSQISGDLGTPWYINNNAGLAIQHTTPAVSFHPRTTNSATNNAPLEVVRIESRTSGVAAAGFGVSQSWSAETATADTYQPQGLISTSWIDATNATRKAKMSLSAYDTAARLGFEIEASGTAAKLAFYGGTTVVRGAALTTQLTTITHTAPGTPDYAIQDLTNVGPFGFVTQDEGNSVLAVIANLQTRVAELEARLGSATGVNLFA